MSLIRWLQDPPCRWAVYGDARWPTAARCRYHGGLDYCLGSHCNCYEARPKPVKLPTEVTWDLRDPAAGILLLVLGVGLSLLLRYLMYAFGGV